MRLPPAHSLSRRERQIMDVLHRRGQATAAVVRSDLPSPPSGSAVRTLLRILETKGHIRHIVDGPRYVYESVAPRVAEQRSALRHLVETFFNGSTDDAVAALLDASEKTLTKRRVEDLKRRIAAARREGR